MATGHWHIDASAATSVSQWFRHSNAGQYPYIAAQADLLVSELFFIACHYSDELQFGAHEESWRSSDDQRFFQMCQRHYVDGLFGCVQNVVVSTRSVLIGIVSELYEHCSQCSGSIFSGCFCLSGRWCLCSNHALSLWKWVVTGLRLFLWTVKAWLTRIREETYFIIYETSHTRYIYCRILNLIRDWKTVFGLLSFSGLWLLLLFQYGHFSCSLWLYQKNKKPSLAREVIQKYVHRWNIIIKPLCHWFIKSLRTKCSKHRVIKKKKKMMHLVDIWLSS